MVSLQISGLHKYSFLDYPGKISCVIFVQGCNWKCSYCHNKQLWEHREGDLTKEEVFKFIEKRKSILEGIVISGGEPTIQTDILSFIKELKQFNLPLKLDTNGSRPDVLETLLPHIDYVAMDIKTCLEENKYSKVCGEKVNIENIKRSMKLISKTERTYHFRTTLDKSLITEEDKKKIEEQFNSKIHIFQCKR